MTLVSGLILNEKKGGLFAGDSRETESYMGRTSDTAEKLFGITPENKPTYFAGFSGPVSNLLDIRNVILKTVSENEPKTTEDLEKILKSSYKTVRDKAAEENILNRYNISWEEFKKGTIDPKLSNHVFELLRDPKGFNVQGIAGGRIKPNEKFTLSYLDYPGTLDTVRKYASVGSGSERADLIMSDYLHAMNSEKRRDIPLDLGTRIMLESMESGWRNIGVGGTGNTPGQIIVAYGDEPFELERESTNLLHNSIFLEKRGVLDKEFVNKVIQEVVGKTKDAKDISKELETEVKSKNFDMFRESLHS